MTQMLTINQAAERLNIHPNTIRNHLTQFGAVDMHGGRSKNRLIRIPEDFIEKYIQGCVIQPPVTTRQARPTIKKLERRKYE